jgi:hypothetical protein
VSRVSLTTIAAVSAIVTFVMFAVGIALMASSGVKVLIPETGKEGLEWIADVDDAGDLFFVGAWLVVFGGVFALVALVGFYEPLRGAGAGDGPRAGAGRRRDDAGDDLPRPPHLDGVRARSWLSRRGRDSARVHRGDVRHARQPQPRAQLHRRHARLGVVVPLYAWAILKTRAVSRWIGWLGFVSAFFAGWLGLLAPASSAIEGITTIGFFAFFAFLLALGIALLRRDRAPAEELLPTTAQ